MTEPDVQKEHGMVSSTPRVTATVPCPAVPAWALAQRALLQSFDAAGRRFAERYLRPDGSLRWNDEQAHRVRSDAFYEPLHNWPDAYLLGGPTSLLEQASRSWPAITEQLTRYGAIRGGFDRSTEWFHLSEGAIVLYGLAAAEPQRWIEPVTHFADQLLAPSHYDAGSRRFRHPQVEPPDPDRTNYPWMPSMKIYGLPLHDVPGISTYDDLQDPELAARMGRAMAERMSAGDGPQSLSATTLITMAHLITGEERYRTWVLDYVGAWLERADANDGIPPDSVGPGGEIGATLGGRWWGGMYGWTWPHGFYNIGMASVVAGTNALLLSGDESYLELPRRLMDRLYAMGEQRELDWDAMSLPHRWQDRWMAFADAPPRTFVVPYRHGPQGWFDHQPPMLALPTTVWAASAHQEDWQRLDHLHEQSGYDWRTVLPFRGKDEAGHEAPWLRFLAGANPDYPERAMQNALAMVHHRLDLIETDARDLDHLGDDAFAPENGRFAYDPKHHATGYNPVLTEALLQLTTGSPQRIYNSGVPVSQLHYADPLTGRPGLPPEIAALVRTVTSDRVVVELVHTGTEATREVTVRAGGYGEHRFTGVRHDTLAEVPDYPGLTGYSLSVRPSPASITLERTFGPTAEITVVLPPGHTITLDLAMARHSARPTLIGAR